MLKKLIRYLVIFPIIIYIGLIVILFLSQKKLVYIPDDTSFNNCSLFEIGEQKEFSGTRFYEQKGKTDKVIIFFHGNAGRACDRVSIKNILQETNHSIIFVEYYGYSDKNKSPSINKILSDVKNIGDYIKNEDKYNQIYVVGRSIGTGPSSYYAENFKTDKLLLISPYSSLYKIGADKYPFFPIKFLFTQNYEPIKYLQKYSGELKIIHGKNDLVVPYKYGLELYDSINSDKKELISVKEGGHNDLLFFEEVRKEIIEFIK